MAHLLEIPIDNLAAYAKIAYGEAATIDSLRVATLEGGSVAPAVYKLDAHITVWEGDPITLSFVQKRTHAAEVRVMRLLGDLALDAIPALVGSNVDEANAQDSGENWFITPFYAGTTLTFDDDVPESIIKALVAVHAFYQKSASTLTWLPSVDAHFVNGLCGWIGTRLDLHRERLPDAVYAEVKALTGSAEMVATLDAAFQRLPKTLTHGDVHPGNIIAPPDDVPILFDWGNARIAPGMLDIANTVEMGSAQWQLYLDTWATVTGEPLDAAVAAQSYVWATAMVNLQYLAFAVEHLDADAVEGMVERTRAAVKGLSAED